MSLRNCSECGRMFEFVFSTCCPECAEKEERNCRLVKDYLKENPEMGVNEISEATGVSCGTIIRMLKNGTLVNVC